MTNRISVWEYTKKAWTDPRYTHLASGLPIYVQRNHAHAKRRRSCTLSPIYITICPELSGGSNSKTLSCQYVSNSFLADNAKIKVFFEIQNTFEVQLWKSRSPICTIILIFVFVTCYLIVNYHYPSDRSSCDLLKRQIAYSLPFGVAVILNTFAGRFDKLLSVSFLTPEEYATYSIAFFGIPGIMQVYDSLCQVNVTNMARLYKDNDILGVKAEYQRFVVKTVQIQRFHFWAGGSILIVCDLQNKNV